MNTKNTENEKMVEDLDLNQLLDIVGGNGSVSRMLVCPKCGGYVANEQALALHMLKKHSDKKKG